MQEGAPCRRLHPKREAKLLLKEIKKRKKWKVFQYHCTFSNKNFTWSLATDCASFCCLYRVSKPMLLQNNPLASVAWNFIVLWTVDYNVIRLPNADARRTLRVPKINLNCVNISAFAIWLQNLPDEILWQPWEISLTNSLCFYLKNLYNQDCE